MTYNLNISNVLGQAWELTKKNWLIMIVVTVCVSLIVQVLASVLGGSTAAMAILTQMQAKGENIDPMAIVPLMTANMGSSILINIVELVLTVGVTKLYLDKAQGSEADFTLEPWHQEPMTYVKYVVVGLITGFITGIGFVCCILPGIFLYARFQFAALAVIQNPQMGIVEAIQYSWNITDGNTLNLILLAIACFVLGLVGLLCCCVGVFVAGVVIEFAGVVAYLMLAQNNQTSAPSAPSGTAE